MPRLPLNDPRTVAREIPGLLDVVLPQLTPGVVAHLNATRIGPVVEPIPAIEVAATSVQRAMLFEIGFAMGEQLIRGEQVEGERAVRVAVQRQRRHFDAQIPQQLTDIDLAVALRVGENLHAMLSLLKAETGGAVQLSPRIPGIEWIASGSGDFAIQETLIEVKCTRDNFTAADYRQIVMYWLLTYSAALESGSTGWSRGILLNPRSGCYVDFNFPALISLVSAGRTQLELLQMFLSLVGTRRS